MVHCPHWLRGWCRDGKTCKLGEHVAAMKGSKPKGADPACPTPQRGEPTPGTDAAKGKGKDKDKGKGKGKGDKDKKKGKGKGGANNRAGTPVRSTTLDPTATLDEKGRPLCYKFMDDRCPLGDECPCYHGPPTEAMLKEKIERQASWAEERKATAAGKAADPNAAAAKAKAKAKAKA